VELPRIAALLAPFGVELNRAQLAQVATYLDLLLRWNARINLTAVRDPEQIVQRHFGESFFAADRLKAALAKEFQPTALDLGSGAGFPGLPLKIAAPNLRVTLIESHARKGTFLNEVIRALGVADASVYRGRAESFAAQARLVTLRAVEEFDRVLPTAASLVAPGGRLALMIGAVQVAKARGGAPGLKWEEPIHVPLSKARTLLVGMNPPKHESNP